jgi:hypothetical protein
MLPVFQYYVVNSKTLMAVAAFNDLSDANEERKQWGDNYWTLSRGTYQAVIESKLKGEE